MCAKPKVVRFGFIISLARNDFCRTQRIGQKEGCKIQLLKSSYQLQTKHDCWTCVPREEFCFRSQTKQVQLQQVTTSEQTVEMLEKNNLEKYSTCPDNIFARPEQKYLPLQGHMKMMDVHPDNQIEIQVAQLWILTIEDWMVALLNFQSCLFRNCSKP